MLDKSVAYTIFTIIVFQRRQILYIYYIRIVVTYSNTSKLNCDNTYIKYILK